MIRLGPSYKTNERNRYLKSRLSALTFHVPIFMELLPPTPSMDWNEPKNLSSQHFNPIFFSMKQPIASLLPPGCDASPYN